MRARKNKKDKMYWKQEEWYEKLSKEGKYIADLIFKSHKYFSRQDKKYKWVVCAYKVIILSLAMIGTIVFGLRGIINTNTQIIVGLIISSSITFFTALISYFNFEEYWRRNIKIHIQLNMIRDHFCLDAESNKIDENKIQQYSKELDKIQKNNIEYWERKFKEN